MIILELGSEKAFVIDKVVGVRDIGKVTFSSCIEISDCICFERRIEGESIEERSVEK